MSESLYLLSICLPLVTVLLIFGMRYIAQIQQAKAVAGGAEAKAKLSAINTTLTDMNVRLMAIEKILKDVE